MPSIKEIIHLSIRSNDDFANKISLSDGILPSPRVDIMRDRSYIL